MSPDPRVRIGTSGWIYKHWRGAFYPEKLPQRQWFESYAGHFDTVEINNTFYRLPPRETFSQWKARAPDGFCYAVKGSNYITHRKRLREPEPHVAMFFDRLAGLGNRTGPVLWQLPPNFRRDDERLQHFLNVLPPEHRCAVEFRHESWLAEDIFQMLKKREVALCIPDGPNYPQALRLTASWTYIRFHHGGRNGKYTLKDLDKWADRIKSFRNQGVQVWAYFNNDWCAYAIGNARELRRRLGDEDVQSKRGTA